MDRISLLPDCLLHDILSSLNTKQVVQTCVLSRRWNTLWTNIPTLNFDFDSDFDSYPFGDYSNASSILSDYGSYLRFKRILFKDFILRVLSEHRSQNIQKLSYSSYGRYDEDQDFVMELFCHAQCLKAQQLCITIFSVDIPMWLRLSSCELLTVLKISGRYVDNLGSLMLPSLRILVIKRICGSKIWDYEDEEDIELNEKTFSGCPNLECFVLIDCLSNSACVSAPKLENLELNGSSACKLKFPEVELRTPNLKSVKFNNVLPFVKSASDFLCIDKVHIAVNSFYKSRSRRQSLENMCQLLRIFGTANSFTLPLNTTKVMFKDPSLRGCWFPNLRHLKFKRERTKEMTELPIGPNTISNFIECPNLQTYSVDSTITKSLRQLSLQDKF